MGTLCWCYNNGFDFHAAPSMCTNVLPDPSLFSFCSNATLHPLQYCSEFFCGMAEVANLEYVMFHLSSIEK